MITPYYQTKMPIVFIEMSKKDAYQLDNLNQQFSVSVQAKFGLKYSYFDRLHKAIDLLSFYTVLRLCTRNFSKLQSTAELHLPFRYQFLSLDYNQVKAVKMIVYGEPKAPIIVVGSAGTGKTKMLAHAVFQIFKVNLTKKPSCVVVYSSKIC